MRLRPVFIGVFERWRMRRTLGWCPGAGTGYLQQINNFQPGASGIRRFGGLTNFPLHPHLDLLRLGFRTCKAVEPLSQCGLSLKTLKLLSRSVARATVAAPSNGWG